MPFEVVDEITRREQSPLVGVSENSAACAKTYGPGRWRKMKGLARVRFPDGTIAHAEVHWYEVHGIGRSELKIKRATRGIVKHRTSNSHLVVCVKNRGFAASLELRKVYRAIPDPAAESHRLVRVVDESGEDYLFPETCFVNIDLPAPVARAIVAAS